MELIGLYLVACALLVVAGTAKAFRPGETAHALAPLVPVDEALVRRTVRVAAVGEAALGVVAIGYPHTLLAAGVGLSYAVFAVFVAYARARGGAIASCGCFGTPDTPATGIHIVVNLVLCLSAISVAAAGPDGSILSILSHQPWHGLPLVVASAAGAWLTFLAVSVLAELQAARRLTAISFRTER
jgi:hypothetical protein